MASSKRLFNPCTNMNTMNNMTDITPPPTSPITKFDPFNTDASLNGNGKRPMTTPPSSGSQGSGKKKVAGRGKCRGCVKRDGSVEAHNLFLKQVVKKSDRLEDTCAQIVSSIMSIKQYIDHALPLVHEVGKMAAKLSNDASMGPGKTDIIELD